MNDSKFMIKLLLNNKTAENRVISPLLLSYREDVPKVIESFRKVEGFSDSVNKATVVLPYISFFRDNGELKSVGVIFAEITYYTDKTGKIINGGDYVGKTSYYYALTRYERTLYHNKKVLKDAHEAIPEHLLNVPDAYPLEVSEHYSDILENYLNEGCKKGTIRSFLDLAFPVIEREQYTLLRKCTVAAIYENLNDWVQKVVNNEFPKETIEILKEDIGNYFKLSNSVFSTLSAAKRGKNVATSDLLRSCPEYMHRSDLLLKQATDANLRISPGFTKLPLFRKQFMNNFLLGYVPLCISYVGGITEESVEYDIFKLFKSSFTQRLEEIVKELQTVLPEGEVKEVICSNNVGYISEAMGRLYESSVKSNFKGMSGFSGISYNCIMVDYLIYTEVLKREGIPLTEMRMKDFIPYVAPFEIPL